MRLSQIVSTGLLGFLCVLAAAAPARAGVFQVVASDARGVTLRLDLAAPVVSAPGADGRSRISIPGLDPLGEPGRPALPVAAGLVALPDGAHATVRVVDGGTEELRAGIRLVPNGRPGLRDDGGRLGLIQVIDSVAAIATGGPWPAAVAELGEPFTVRRQRVVALRVRPVRYDEAAATVWWRRSITVRVEFSGTGAAPRPSATPSAPDRHWDPVLEAAVVNFDAARAWRTSPVRATASALETVRRTAPRSAATATLAFDESNPEVRCLVDTTGIVGLTYANLTAAGFPSGIPVAQVSVHRHEYVSGANPPYVTVELPIEIDDRNNNGVFDNADRVLVFVQNWAERSRASIAQRAWGDAEALFVTYLTGRAGLRVATRSGWTGPNRTPLTSYYVRQRFEKSTVYMNTFVPAEADTNTDPFLWTGFGAYDRNDPQYTDVTTFPFETNDIDTSRPVDIRVQWSGLKAAVNFQRSVHIAYAEVRNAANTWTTVVDSATWGGRLTRTFGATLPGGTVSNARTNVLRLFGRTVGVFGNILNAGLNWFDVTYPRAYKAVSGRLYCTSDSVSGAFQIDATGFRVPNPSQFIRVYDVTDSLAPVRLTLPDSVFSTGAAPYTVRFQDTSAGGALRRYVVFDSPVLVPAAKFSAVTRRDLAGHGPADMLIVTPEAYIEAADELATQRRADGLTVLVCPVESVNDEFNGGRKSSYAIRRLLQYAYANWDARFVTLLGDGSEDPLNLTGTAGPDLIAAQKIAGPVGIFDGSTSYEAIVSDPWYVWSLSTPNGPTGPFLHDMFIGRLPVSSLEQALALVDKLDKYDVVTPDQTWRRKVMLCSDDQFSTQSFFGGNPEGGPSYCKKTDEASFLGLNQQARAVLVNEGGFRDEDIENFDLAEYLAGIETEVQGGSICRKDWHATQDYTHLNVTPVMFDHLRDGRAWWNFEGHANPYVLTHEDLYRNSSSSDDQVYFNNVDKPFLFSAFSCHPNQFGTVIEADPLRGPSLGEEMVVLPQAGAIASYGSTGYELLAGDWMFGEHLTVHFARALYTDPPRDPYLGQGGARVVLGEAIALALINNYAANFGDPVGISYHLLGDAATRFTIGAPLSNVLANGQAVTSGEPVRLHTVGDTLRLDADLVSNVRLTSIVLQRTVDGVTTTIPATAYTITPAFPDTGAASHGGRRFHLTYQTTLLPQTTTYTIRTTDRYGVTGTFEVLVPFQTVLRADGAPVGNGEEISPSAVLTVTVLAPSPLTLPAGLTVTLNGEPVTYTFVPANGDTTGREWTLTLPHVPLAAGDYRLVVQIPGGGSSAHVFTVETNTGKVAIRNAYLFPNPFDDRGTQLTFRLSAQAPVDVQFRVYTVTGRLIYKQDERALAPGYHQIPWGGGDSDGQSIANGLYLYRIIATDGATTDTFESRLVKLRRPRRTVEPTSDSETP